MSKADSAAGQAVLPPGTPQHPLYRCRRHLVGDERRDCGLPRVGSGVGHYAPSGSSLDEVHP